jgi:hypothetical protein
MFNELIEIEDVLTEMRYSDDKLTIPERSVLENIEELLQEILNR